MLFVPVNGILCVLYGAQTPCAQQISTTNSTSTTLSLTLIVNSLHPFHGQTSGLEVFLSTRVDKSLITNEFINHSRYGS